MSGEVSYLSRFFVKFVEVIAAGVATAISAYLLAHFGGLLPPSTPVSAPAPTSVSEKEPRQKSAEALARAALANVDANRPAPADTLIGPGLTDARSAPVD